MKINALAESGKIFSPSYDLGKLMLQDGAQVKELLKLNKSTTSNSTV